VIAHAHLWGISALPFIALAVFGSRWFTPGWIFLLNLTGGFFCIGADIFYFIVDYRHDRPGSMAADAILIAVWVWIIWVAWNNWKNNRKRLLALIGAKSRALLERLTRKMAEQGTGA
jgi:hypothetical protein